MTDLLPDIQGRRILIAPLYWGLGHATRCLPLIDHYLKTNDIELASDGLALEWLQQECPELKTHELPSYNISYRGAPSIFAHLSYALQAKRAIEREGRAISSLIEQRGFDLIISDHRLGARHRDVRSILIAHQLSIPYDSDLVERVASRIQLRYISKFDECWVPDYNDESNRISGDLSSILLPITKRYIGPLSRMQNQSNGPKDLDLLIILSGVEPDRSHLEQKLIDICHARHSYRIALVRGANTIAPSIDFPPTIETYHLADTSQLQSLMTRAKLVVSRSGYSTLMDLETIGLPAILIPSEYQPEQQYLARLVSHQSRYVELLEADLTRDTLFTEVDRLLHLSK